MGMDWNQRVRDYVDRLETLTAELDDRLDSIRMPPLRAGEESASRNGATGRSVTESTAAASEGAAPEGLEELAELVRRLETFVSERETLLADDEAPQQGWTLTEKLLGTRRIDDARLAKRCRETSERIRTAHQRAVSLFVCQFHLANFGNDLLKLLSGAPETTTYGGGQPTRGQGGGLFNDAA